VVGLLLLGAGPAVGSAGPVDRAFPGGTFSQLAINDGPTAGSFANLSYEYTGCGKMTGETSCTWRIDVGLAPDGSELCASLADPMIWSSGEQNGNGSIASGPRSFALRGTPGQVLCVFLTYTLVGEHAGAEFSEGGSKVLDSVVMAPGLLSPIEAIERRIIEANTAASLQPPPSYPALTISPDCRTLRIGNVSYFFSYHQMGCRKAGDLASMAHSSRRAPNGYHCASRPNGGRRCWRRGHPRKYVEWRPPNPVPAAAPR
jgi:hypothetical protein